MIVALCAACGGREDAMPLSVAVEGPIEASTPPYVSAPGLADRARAVASTAAITWGAAPHALDGWSLTFAQAPFACGEAAANRAIGCTRWDEREIEVLAFGAACPEATALPHEVGHVVLRDARHDDPRWCDRAFWRRMREALAPTAPAGCTLDDFVERNAAGCDDDLDHED
jgi:hypothetical protein